MKLAQELDFVVEKFKQRGNRMKAIKTLTAIILAEIAIAIPILISIYVWSMVFFV